MLSKVSLLAVAPDEYLATLDTLNSLIGHRVPPCFTPSALTGTSAGPSHTKSELPGSPKKTNLTVLSIHHPPPKGTASALCQSLSVSPFVLPPKQMQLLPLDRSPDKEVSVSGCYA